MLFAQSIMLMIFGLGVGTVGTMLGIGGGWIHVPFLMMLFHFSPTLAIGTSVGIIFFNVFMRGGSRRPGETKQAAPSISGH